MVSFLHIGQILAGVAVFLVGTNFMEESVRSLAGRNFKLFLKKQTSSKIKAIGGGAVVTGFLQSSSIVNLLILSLAGAGVIQLKSALAVMLGSNLGSTLNSWIVALFGFKMDITSYAFFVAGITGISLAFFRAGSRLFLWCRFLLGLSFLFVGLGIIKTGMEAVMGQTDLGHLADYPVIIFFVIGLVLTAIVQSSSATIAIALSALYTDGISLHAAMGVVLGSEIGTTVKLFLASANGLAIKKQLALGNFLVNCINVTIMLILLGPLHNLIINKFGIRDPVLALVFFQSLLNITSIMLFYPLLNVFSKFLEKRYKSDEEDSFYINKVPLTDTELAIDTLRKEIKQFLQHIIYFTASAFGTGKELPARSLRKNFLGESPEEMYGYIKRYHGEIHAFYTRLQRTGLSHEHALLAEQLVSCTRNGMYAAKNIKDAFQDIAQLQNSSNDKKYEYYLQVKKNVTNFCNEALSLVDEKPAGHPAETISAMYKSIQDGYTTELDNLYKEGMAQHLGEEEVSTLFNFNREMYTAYKSLVFALKDYLLDRNEADQFDELPGFIR